ncbi:hypothetical protein [Paraburkholderia youngii]|uniref:hypothetical protein n=1 Tax=Paraburkholderia youngii TaxID=2782701 RepID=UPI003D230E3D
MQAYVDLCPYVDAFPFERGQEMIICGHPNARELAGNESASQKTPLFSPAFASARRWRRGIFA